MLKLSVISFQIKSEKMLEAESLLPVVILRRLNLELVKEKVSAVKNRSNSLQENGEFSMNSSSTHNEDDPYDTFSDSDYLPDNESDSELSVEENFFAKYEITTVDISEQHKIASCIGQAKVPEKKKLVAKKHSCFYCQKLLTNMPRHLERHHNKEPLVKDALNVPKGSEERMSILDRLRKEGDRKYNMNNENHLQINVRNSNKSNAFYTPCPVCYGYYSIKNLNDHVREYHRDKENARKYVLGRSKVLSLHIHPEASPTLRQVMYPSLKNINILKLAATDDTVVRYANSLVNKYYRINNHQRGMVTTFFRFIGKLFFCFQEFIPTAKRVKDMIDPLMYDTVVKTINKVAGLREDGRFEAPTNATNACTLLAKIGNFLQCKAIEEQNQEEREKFKDFLYLLQIRQNSDITKMALESRTAFQRRKVEDLPTTQEINNLFSKIEAEITKACATLKEGFSEVTWTKLMQYVLASIVVFNRRRPGDVEKTELVEYYTMISLHEDQRKNLSELEKKRADKFYRFRARGKLNKLASVLISKENKSALDLLIKYREHARIPTTNKYLFSNPGSGSLYFKADKALKLFCREHNFSEKLFTATKLRKHLATCTSTLPQRDQEEISYFMGHSMKIHNSIYIQRLAESDIIHMGHILSKASGLVEREQEINCQETNNNEAPTWLESGSSNSSYNTERYERNIGELSTIHESTNKLFDSLSDTEQYQNNCQLSTPKTTSVKQNRIREPQLRRYKRTWETPEREILRNAFHDFFTDNVQPPSLTQCQDIILEKKIKLKRTLPQIHSWVIAEKRRKMKGNTMKKGWNTPEKQACRKYFQEYYEKTTDNQYPTTDELQQAVLKVPELEGKTVPVLRSHLQHDFDYMRKRRSI